MGIVNFSIPKDLVLGFIKNDTFENFIETGTYKGDTSFWAAQHFKKVFTIEIDPDISKETSTKKGVPYNIEFIVGDSRNILKDVVTNLQGKSFFWLDGHWCSGAGGKDQECPLMTEIDAISPLQDPVIFIDDARCFLGPLPLPHNYTDWPTIDDIILKLKSYYPSSFVTIIDDVIVCVPASLRNIVYDYWMKSFDARYSSPSVQHQLKALGKRNIIKYLFGLH